MELNDKILENILSDLENTNECEHRYFGCRSDIIPSRKKIIGIIKNLQELMFGDYFSSSENIGKDKSEILEETLLLLKSEICAAYSFYGDNVGQDAQSVALEILSELPKIKCMLIKDAQAIYEGDPAARSAEEVILCYPGFYAISIYRLAHIFYLKKIPYISRIMTEYAHEKTGIDIHAGATVGEYFFIDHGTGIVIGETTTIGDHVKIYQGVTLGAKSFELDADGNPIKGTKRHPDIADNCVIYANATILGGSTKIGRGAVIGGNVWLTHSVGEGEVVYYDKK